MKEGFFLNLLRTILSAIDFVIFKVLAIIMQGFFNIANFDFFGPESIQDFADRIYVILGVFMLFKLAFSLITALINPERLTDKQNGTSKLVVRVITVIILLVAVPTIFDLAKEGQNALVETIPRVVLGRDLSKTTGTTTGSADQDKSNLNDPGSIANVGEWMAATTYRTFINFDSDHCKSKKQQDALEQVSEKSAFKVEDLVNLVNVKCEDSDYYAYSYTFIVPWLVGAFLIFVILLYSIDIAIRTIKWGILRIMAPIPIISYVDPKSAKDGAFAGWIKNCISTYLDLFLKLGLMYFVVYILRIIITDNIYGRAIKDYGFLGGSYVMLFIIIGLFFFLKQAPKFIQDILGIKGGSGSLLGIAGSAILGGAGGLIAGGGLSGMLSGAWNGANAANAAVASGKPMQQNAYSAQRARIAQMKTGDKNAQGGLNERFTNFLSGRSNERLASSMGLSEANINAGKNQAAQAGLAAEDAGRKYQNAAALYQNHQLAPDPGQFNRTAPVAPMSAPPQAPDKSNYHTVGPDGSIDLGSYNEAAYQRDFAQYEADQKVYNDYLSAQQDYDAALADYNQRVLQYNDSVAEHTRLEQAMQDAEQELRVASDWANATKMASDKADAQRKTFVPDKPKYTSKRGKSYDVTGSAESQYNKINRTGNPHR